MYRGAIKLSQKKIVSSENAAKELIVKNGVRNTRWSFMPCIEAKLYLK